MNSKYGRIELEATLPEPYLSSVLAVWGEEPTIVDDELDKLLGNQESINEETEVEYGIEQGVHPISLGRRILRTETAGLMLCSVLMYKLED